MITGGTASIETIEERYRSQPLDDTDIIVVGVDSLETRQSIWNHRHMFGDWSLYLDGRIGYDQASVYAVRNGDEAAAAHYESTLLRPTGELPCGQKATAYICYLIAGMLGSLVVLWLNRQPLPHEMYQKTMLESGAGPFYSVVNAS